MKNIHNEGSLVPFEEQSESPKIESVTFPSKCISQFWTYWFLTFLTACIFVKGAARNFNFFSFFQC